MMSKCFVVIEILRRHPPPRPTWFTPHSSSQPTQKPSTILSCTVPIHHNLEDPSKDCMRTCWRCYRRTLSWPLKYFFCYFHHNGSYKICWLLSSPTHSNWLTCTYNLNQDSLGREAPTAQSISLKDERRKTVPTDKLTLSPLVLCTEYWEVGLGFGALIVIPIFAYGIWLLQEIDIDRTRLGRSDSGWWVHGIVVLLA